MTTNTKTLFAALLKELPADCVADIGSRDGDQAMLFRDLLPNAAVLAFEANPLMFKQMSANPRLRQHRIEIFPYAVADKKGTLDFHITDVDYSNPEENRGTSSLLVHSDVKVKEVISIEACRIDTFILERYPQISRIGLWIDAEGAEYRILQGMEGIKHRVYAVHVETSNEALRIGQKTYAEICALMNSYGFEPCGTNIGAGAVWGDVVFIRSDWRRKLGMRFNLCKAKAAISRWVQADQIAVALKTRAPGLYRVLRALYIRLFT